MSWTDERIDRLKAMWNEGKTASQIAEELGGVSRNAVIGKAHRLGLDSRPSPVKGNEEKAEAAPAPAPKPTAKLVEPTRVKERPAIAAALEASAPMPPAPAAAPEAAPAAAPEAAP